MQAEAVSDDFEKPVFSSEILFAENRAGRRLKKN
jgi:hypothetical protein